MSQPLLGVLKRHRRALGLLAKVLIAALPLYFLIAGARFDLGRQAALLQEPAAIALLFCIWALSFVLLVAWRWQFVSRILGLELPLGFALGAHLAGVFMSSWLPGSIGGDIWKAYRYGALLKGTDGQTTAYLSVVLDRVFGLYALVLCGSLCVLLEIGLWLDSAYAALALLLLGLCLLLSLAGGLVLTAAFPLPASLAALLERGKARYRLVEGFAGHLRAMRENKRLFLPCISISIVIQVLNVVFFGTIATLVTGQAVSFITMSSVFTISLLITILSMAPGGLGVGHLMVELLFSDVGLPSGADVFNVFFVLTTLFSLIGALPYLLPDAASRRRAR